MPIRPATYRDLLPSARLLAAAFKHEDLFANTIHIHQAEYPNDPYLFFLHQLRGLYFSSPLNHLLISYQPSSPSSSSSSSSTFSSTPGEQITGFACWSRYTAQPPSTLTETLLSHAVRIYNYLESWLYPNRAADPAQLDIFRRALPFNKHHWTGTRAEVWTLELLATDPAAEGRGIGREMVQWGFERAKGEGVGCSVVSSEGRERFYQRCGFDVIAGNSGDFGGEANPLSKVKGGTILFWDNGVEPEGIKGYGEA